MSERAEHLREVAQYFDSVEKPQINQSFGWWKADGPCCVGAHLAGFYGVAKAQIGESRGGPKIDYQQGYRELALRLGISNSTLKFELFHNGAPRSPFGEYIWFIPPAQVFRNMADLFEEHDQEGQELNA